MRAGREAAVPAAVTGALEQLLGEPVGHVRVVEHSLFARLHGAFATTRLARIYLRGSAEEFFGNPWLMLHEYCHVLRQWQTGSLTVPRYLLECARRGYWNNRFEVEARAFADQHAPRLHMMLSAGPRTARVAPVVEGVARDTSSNTELSLETPTTASAGSDAAAHPPSPPQPSSASRR